MKYDLEIHHRRSIRLKGFDYSQNGAYFITLCTQGRKCMFGEIKGGEMNLNDAGEMAQQCWHEIPKHYPPVVLDEFIVMPNHIHGILMIENHDNVGANDYSPVSPQRPNGTSKTIGAIIRRFKIGVTKWCHTNTNTPVVWQRNYYEHIIRDDDDLNHIREYIINNPIDWNNDDLFTNSP